MTAVPPVRFATSWPYIAARTASTSVDPAAVRRVHGQLLASRAWGLEHLDLLAESAAGATGLPVSVCRDYLGELDYGLGPSHLAGLTHFFGALAEDGLAPLPPLAFLDAA